MEEKMFTDEPEPDHVFDSINVVVWLQGSIPIFGADPFTTWCPLVWQMVPRDYLNENKRGREAKGASLLPRGWAGPGVSCPLEAGAVPAEVYEESARWLRALTSRQDLASALPTPAPKETGSFSEKLFSFIMPPPSIKTDYERFSGGLNSTL